MRALVDLRNNLYINANNGTLTLLFTVTFDKMQFMISKNNDDYRKIINKHYVSEADKHRLSLSSTMPDLNIRRLEIDNITKYIEDGEHCLEVGCGNGAASVEICRRKQINLLGIDVTKEMIDLAKEQSLQGIKGNLEFRHEDILALNESATFDTVFSVRCIINILNWNEQKTALENMAKAVKKGGHLVLLESFNDGLLELNQARQELNLDPIVRVAHNLDMDKDLVKQHLFAHGLEFSTEDNFLSSYIFGTRVIYPALAKANNTDIVHNSKFDSFFSHFPAYGNFSYIKSLAFNKN